MQLRTRIIVLIVATVFFAIISVILSFITALIAAHFRYGHAELGSNDVFLEGSLLVFGLLSCAALYEVWKMMAEDDESSNG